jgi:DNA gyrase/topoisomerase IV subunit A
MGVDVAGFDKELQGWIYEYYRDNNFLKPVQIQALKETPNLENIAQRTVIQIMNDALPDSNSKANGKVTLSEKKLDEYIIAQLEEGIKKYGRPRLSKIVRDETDNDSIPDIDYLVGITNNGMVKKIPAKVYTSIGNVGNNHDGLSVLLINNKESLLILDESGRLSKIAVSTLPDMKFEDTGVELSKYIGQFSTVKAIMELPNKTLLKKDTDLYILIITEQGYSKMVSMTEFAKMKTSLSAITLTKGDKVADAIFVRAGSLKDIIFYTNKGNGMRLKNEEFRIYGASARGLKMVQLTDDEKIVGVCRISVTKGNLVYITNKGNMKLTELKYFPVMKRNDALLPLIMLGANERLIGVATVAKDDLIRLYCSKSEWLDVSTSDIPLKARMAKGSKICPVPKGDTIVAFKIFRK